MAAPNPSVLTIYYGTSSTVTLPINPVAGVLDFTLFVATLAKAGGFWFVDAAGLQTYIPWLQVTKCTAA